MLTIRERVDALPGQLPITLAPDALDASIALKKRWETEGKNLVEQANSRAFLHVMRFGLIYALADGDRHIRVTHLEAAEGLVKRMAAGVRRQATAELSDKIAQRIIDHMREDTSEALTRTGISSAVFSRNVPARDLENAIHTLLNLGMLRVHRDVFCSPFGRGLS
jgi:hypothetical protein